MATIAVLGNAGVDVTIRGALPSEGAGGDLWTDRNVRFLDEAPTAVLAGNGGAAAYVLGRLGQAVTLVTSLGEDPFGQLARRQLAEANVSIRSLPDAQTPVNVIGVDEAGGRSSAYFTGSAIPWKVVLEDEFSWVYAAGFGQVGSDDLEVLGDVFLRVRESGGNIAFDPGPWLTRDPFLSHLREIIHQVDCLLGTEEELAALSSKADPDAILDGLMAYGPTRVAVKRGREGAIVASGDERVQQSVEPVDGAHSVGAGDCFNAAFLSACVDGASLREAVSSAVALSRRAVVSGRGSTGAFGS